MSAKQATAKVSKDGVMPLLSRLFAILALLLMPISMAATLATAAEHSRVETAMPCDGHEQPSKSAPDPQVHCTSCVAVAEPSLTPSEGSLEPVAILADRDERLLLGILLEVATPPPRAS